MFTRHSFTRRDALLVFLGAVAMHIWWTLFYHPVFLDQTDVQPQVAPQNGRVATYTTTSLAVKTETETATTTATYFSKPSPIPAVDASTHLPHTSIVAHAPGWTLFRNLYMSNGTLYILSSNRSFPEIRMMTSTGLPAQNTPENIASREPTSHDMDYVTPEQAHQRWGGDTERGEHNRVWSVEGNTVLFNDPHQFLRHYYHFVAELFFGTWAFWRGAWSPPSQPTPSFLPPPIHRAIFAHSNADGWRDNPGFNAYFLRAAFPSLTVEVQEDWADRIAATRSPGSHTTTTNSHSPDRAWHFPLLLLVDRSAAHRGAICGSQTQRTASEAWEFMKAHHQLVGGWWDPVRRAVWRFAGVAAAPSPISTIAGTASIVPADSDSSGEPTNEVASDKIVITYISRQGVPRRKLVQEDHEGLVAALEELVKTKGPSWELNVLQAERMTKDDQVKAVARTTILLGVHGNGLTHLVFMKPTRASAVIELFYPGGFAHDYQWTTRALGMDYYAVWNDRYFTHDTKPRVAYPKGFQDDYIPVDGQAVSRLIEDHVERQRSAA